MSEGALPLPDLAAMTALGRDVAAVLRPGDAIALSGALGAGKTTLARAVLAALGLEDEAPSPSFPIVIAYAPPELGVALWHVDLYRIDDPRDLAELGLDDARADAALLIEWPERMGDRLWPDALRLTLHDAGDAGRRLTWAAPAAWRERWPPRP